MDIEKLPLPSPGFIPPMLAKLAAELPTGDGWMYELKLDGFRSLALKDNKTIRLISRNDKNLTDSRGAEIGSGGHRC